MQESNKAEEKEFNWTCQIDVVLHPNLYYDGKFTYRDQNNDEIQSDYKNITLYGDSPKKLLNFVKTNTQFIQVGNLKFI